MAWLTTDLTDGLVAGVLKLPGHLLEAPGAEADSMVTMLYLTQISEKEA